jgi:hypothetical protein
MRSVCFIITTCGDGFIDRSPHIATADLAYGIGGLAGLPYTSTCLRSVRAVLSRAFLNALCDLGVFLCRLVRREYLSPRQWHFGMACASSSV